MATKIVISIPNEDSYEVRIGPGLLDTLGTQLRKRSRFEAVERVVIITDDNVAPLYREKTKQALRAAGYKTSDIVVPAGEGAKSLLIAEEIWQALAEQTFGRDGLVVALGGGVVGDLAGFVSSTYMRGVPFVQVPTTLLAMVDSSVGGKTGINLASGKNLVGTFAQPAYVCADTSTLKTLSERDWMCGCAEIAKAAVIDSDQAFFLLSDQAESLIRRDEQAVTEAIVHSVVFKATVVSEDKTELSGRRACLNYGHTLGHAIENLAGYGTFSHGAAVAEGMRFAARLAVSQLDASLDFVSAQDDLLDALGLSALAWRAKPNDLLNAMKRDKKVRKGSVHFVLPRDVGAWELVHIDDEVLREHLEAWVRSKD